MEHSYPEMFDLTRRYRLQGSLPLSRILKNAFPQFLALRRMPRKLYPPLPPSYKK